MSISQFLFFFSQRQSIKILWLLLFLLYLFFLSGLNDYIVNFFCYYYYINNNNNNNKGILKKRKRKKLNLASKRDNKI